MAREFYKPDPKGLSDAVRMVQMAALRGYDGGQAGLNQLAARMFNEINRAFGVLRAAADEAAHGRTSYDDLRAAILSALGVEG